MLVDAPVASVTANPGIDGDALLGGALVVVALAVAGYLLVRFWSSAVALVGPLLSLAFVVAVVLFLRGPPDV